MRIFMYAIKTFFALALTAGLILPASISAGVMTIQKISLDQAKAMKVIDLEVLQTMPSTFYGTLVSCLVIIKDISERKWGFQLDVTDFENKRILKLPFFISKFVDHRERPFIIEIMKIKNLPMILTGMINKDVDTGEIKFDAREFYLINK